MFGRFCLCRVELCVGGGCADNLRRSHTWRKHWSPLAIVSAVVVIISMFSSICVAIIMMDMFVYIYIYIYIYMYYVYVYD